jgi:hypothetical protein
MLLILEVLLTVSAWRKGWGPKALLPLAIGVPLGVFATINAHSLVPAFVCDVLITIVLIAMSVNGRKAQPAAPSVPAPADEVTRQNAA